MPHISIKDLSVDFVVYGTNSRSLKKQLVLQASGGRVMKGARDVVSVRALDDISLEVEHGDRIGLVGHNGSGKTTLLRVLAGIYRPTHGSVTMSGGVGALLDPSAGMDQDSTGVENIYLRGYVLGMSKPEIKRHIDDIAVFTGLGDFLKLPLRTYSAGMSARLAFAISTVIRPDILLMDEGVAVGDAEFFDKMQARLSEFVMGASILVLASHNSSIINRFCTKRLTLNHGKIVSFEKIEPPVVKEPDAKEIDNSMQLAVGSPV
jgi:ABC-type polysaccharide/polyol phosphate transport system ATPase subunit